MNRQQAEEIISSHQRSAPVNVQSIAKDFGIDVFAEALPDNISGKLSKRLKNGTGNYVIIVNSKHPTNRKRFTVAHELAHFVLHRDRVSNELIEDEFYRALSNKLEREANEFAADILMPWHLINQLSEAGNNSLPRLASALGVSQQALAIRLGLPYDQDWK